MKTQPQNPANVHAIVIGGSMAGLLAARILSDHFGHVTLIERDPVQDQPEARKGQPHTRHLHGLLAKGLAEISQLFPDIKQALVDGGAIMGDMGATMRWYQFGGYKQQFASGMSGMLMSRPFLEWQIRRRVLALPNVAFLAACDVEGLITTPDQHRVIGVNVVHRAAEQRAEKLTADLVVDASGRGSASPKWLEALGYGRPQENLVKMGMGYTTRIYRRKPGDLVGAELVMVSPTPPHDKRSGLIFPIEGDRWIVTLGGWAGDHAPADEQGFLDFARSLAAPDIYNIISRAEPLSDIITHKFPASLRRHYEQMKRFPDGYLVMGDAICSFNPIYGQGMTSAALQVAALGKLLGQRQGNLAGLAQAFFQQAAKVVDIPWQLAVGEDFRYPTTEGKKAPGTDLINAYVTQVHKATHHDTIVYAQFLKVMNLMEPPTSLFKPQILWRVFKASRAEKRSAAAMRAQEAY